MSSTDLSTPTWRARLAQRLADLRPAALPVDARERWRVAAGAGLGLLFTALLSAAVAPSLGGQAGLQWLIAPLGASAVLVFGLPASPLAQPWSVVGGNSVSALVGIAVTTTLGSTPSTAALAVALAIGAMFATRCLHPPGGASALLVVLSNVHDPVFALTPVFTHSLALAAAGIVYNNATGKRYPHGQSLATPAPSAPRPVFSEADLDAVLRRYNQVLDVSRDDLQALLAQTELEAYRRRLGELRCRDVMSTDLVTVEFGDSLQDAWKLLRERRIKALPVVDKVRRVVGVVTLADFMRHADVDFHHGWVDKLRSFLTPSPTPYTTKPETVGQIMVRQVRVASADRRLSELVPLFADTGHHHIPIIDDDKRLVGIITQSDVVAALCRSA
ncbi:HPP family protein [Piscinibacter sp. HJYY11]|uniref:HPP family protein n=1 Tax=Piscinibacter sp. HJYY11 TaxID=2801333 RepID=UPI00191EFE56|nr:HPP family protein [Piscinibacter sp. HJYY11]MBL0730791.1 HPP family protein [Piscinibacter sp. HJYY11]